jgi:hypothetical protein
MLVNLNTEVYKMSFYTKFLQRHVATFASVVLSRKRGFAVKNAGPPLSVREGIPLRSEIPLRTP